MAQLPYLRHGEVKNRVAGASGVLQVVEHLNVTAFLQDLCKSCAREGIKTCARVHESKPSSRAWNMSEREYADWSSCKSDWNFLQPHLAVG